jgi:hypothetical protein
VPLGLEIAQSAIVHFNASTLDNIPSGVHVWFYDTKVGHSQDLLVNPSYSVPLGSGTYENRFFLMMSPKESVVIPGVNGQLNAYANGNNLYVYVTYGTGTLIVTDISGQTVYKQQLTGNGYHMVTLDVASGVYIATLYSEMGKQSKKVFIGNE